MRPSPDICAKPPPGSPSLDSFDPRTPATFFLSRNPSSDPPSPASEDELPAETMYGVHSLDESLSQLATSPPPPEHSLHYDLGSPIARRRSTLKPRESPMSAASRPLTPLNLSTPDEPSLPSSPKSISNHSLRPLDDISITDEINSQPVGSGDEEEGPRTSPRLGPGGASQLIMPSIRMPSRRPFTERGKAMGRFKVLLAGAPGAGKTSLIKSIVQACEDIVHVDSLPPVTAIERRPSRSQPGPIATHGTLSAISEIYASTKPYPSWWSDLEDSRVLRRRKSIGEIVLERNLCFVDTRATSLSRAGQTDAVVQYMRQQLLRATAALSSSGVYFQNLLAGNGGSQVDAIIYLISSDTLAADVECIRKLCELTNVIPVVSKSDTLSPEQITVLKDQFHQQARDAGIKPFLFGDPGPGGSEPQPPYAVSSEKTTDLEVMDASTLMSPDYVQPLVLSEMDTLVRKMFDRDNLAWMRHSAAKKLAQHRDGFPSVPPTTAPLLNALSGPSSSEVGWRVASGASMGYSIFSSGGSPPSYAMARLTDTTQHEERLAQVGLAQWATNLQRSLQNERDRYAALARGDRAVWLTERLSECVVDGSLVPLAQTPGFRGLHIPSSEKNADGVRVVRSRSGEGATEYRIASLGPHDPLGVVGWIDDLGRRGWVLVQIVGSVGVVGGLALWLARTCGLPIRSLAELNLDYWCGSVDR
ncbi:hypothetical protein NUU61_002454 [Penicillium alfredii]|uniref:Septin-type G domain-containing protein n=1 Tax=Penicillium alfredii TaxID=1506179 RepID=A0A9W9KHA8_9EURO|nr:uncharacterized protein NUU61_002454 [Penicillium alfredii]KAJ5105107.1 hypothetical protein NUU61_002454 [Penicillium alfredii]